MNDQWTTHQIDIGPSRAGDDQREWLLTNGTGAYAMGTVGGGNTRRYHGLFVAATTPPVGRRVVLNQMLERLIVGRKTLEFTTCHFLDPSGDLIEAPGGNRYLQRFERGLTVKWFYEADGVEFIRQLNLNWKQQAATLRYVIRNVPKTGAMLSLYPMVTMRDFHELLQRTNSGGFVCQSSGHQVTVRRGQTEATMVCGGGSFVDECHWWDHLYYPLDAERGQEDHEDYYVPGRFEVPLDGGRDQEVTFTVALGTSPAAAEHEPTPRAEHLASMRAVGAGGVGGIGGTGGAGPSAKMLAIAADDFVVDRQIRGERLTTILAGYPWFADWGRDTLIALPGLLLATGRFDEANETLRAFAQSIQDGLVPNRFDDYDQQAAHYNTVDASLWFIHAALEYMAATNDRASWDAYLRAAVMAIIEAYVQGTRYDIAVTGDCLISAGSPQTQLTWMDAAQGGTVFTPRFGKAVEINALWYHALVGTMQLIAEDDPKTADHYKRLANRVRRAFSKVFWIDECGWLRDCVWTDTDGNEHIDTTFRPNQILAASVPNSPLPRTKQNKVISAVGSKLLTPFGLQTLACDDRNFHGRYWGGPFARDEAYHQGTVWPWLIGPYAEAILRAGQFTPRAVAEARSVIEPLLQFMSEGSVGQLFEIHEADPPHAPVGCMAQAWSVAQVIRVLHLIETSEKVAPKSQRVATA